MIQGNLRDKVKRIISFNECVHMGKINAHRENVVIAFITFDSFDSDKYYLCL